MIKNNFKAILFASLIVAMILPFSNMEMVHAVSSTDDIIELSNAAFIPMITELSDEEWKKNQMDAEKEHALILKKFEKSYVTDEQFAKAVDTIRALASDSRNIDDDRKWNTYMSSLQYVAEKSNPNKINRLDSQNSEQLRELIRSGIIQAEFSAKIASDSVMLSDSPSKIERGATATCNALKDERAPYLFQPKFDVVSPANNGLRAIHSVMYDGSVFGSSYTGKCVLEVNLVYHDEDSPVFDDQYDSDRLTNWGRIYDIETFYVVGDIANGKIDRFSYVNLWITKTTGDERKLSPIGNGSIFNWNLPAHWKGTDTPKYTYNGEQIIFVNTFNHAMGEDFDAATMFPATAYDLDRYDSNGSRPGVENAYSTIDYKSQYRVEYP